MVGAAFSRESADYSAIAYYQGTEEIEFGSRKGKVGIWKLEYFQL